METSFGAACLDYLSKVSVQVAVLAVIVFVATRIAHRAPAAWRNALWLLVVVKLLVPPFAYYPSNLAFWQSHEREAARPIVQSIDATVSRVSTPNGAASPVPASPRPSTGAMILREPSPAIDAGTAARGGKRPALSVASVLCSAWLVGVCLMLLLLAVRLARQVRLVWRSLRASQELTGLLADAAQCLGVKRLPRLRLSPDATTPMLIGFVRPVILLPSDISDKCGASDLKAILLHELAHIKRRDLAAVWLHQIAQLLFYFHPAAWLAGREIRMEREIACDEMVLSRSAIPPKDYAAGYVSALKLANGTRPLAASLSMAEPLEMEKSRLNRILGGAIPRLSGPWIAALAVIAAVGLPTFAGLGCAREETAEDLLAHVREARANALAMAKNGKGSLTLSTYRADGADQEAARQAYAVSVAFAGEKFTYSARRIGMGTAYDFDAVCDGRTLSTTYLQIGSTKTYDIRSQETNIHTYSLRHNFDVVQQAYPNLSKVLFLHKGQPRIVGHEMVDGSNCVVVESVQEFPQKNGAKIVETGRLWVDPARGYTVPRMQVWSEGAEFKDKTMLSESNVELSQYDGIWGPARYAHAEYRADPKSGKRYLSYRRVVTYGRGFVLNVPVSDSDFRLPFAGPQTEPADRSQENELQDARVLAGMTAVEGPGVIVNLRDSPKLSPEEKDPDVRCHYQVHDTDVRSVINELFSAGAEAVSVNDQRVVVTSAIRCVGPAITVNSVPVKVPIGIKAIGPAEVLDGGLRTKGGPAESLFLLDMISIQKSKTLVVPAFKGKTHSNYARPAASRPKPVRRVRIAEGNRYNVGPAYDNELPCEGRVTTHYGYRKHPTTGMVKLHTGVDITAPPETPIHAVADGTVILSGWQGAYGDTVVINHGQGVSTLYSHCSALAVPTGTEVRRGQVIAYVGATGYATGPHCHFEKRVNGKPVNPI